MTELAELEAACLSGLVETRHGYRYRPAVAAAAVEPLLAAARAKGARDMRTKIEELADDFHDRSQSHAWPTPSSMAYRDAWRTASTVLRALLADGGEPQ